jgi:inosine triphosphate pyrophosphatase
MAIAIPITINFITGNKHKLREAKAILGDTMELVNQKIELPEIQGCLEEIARDKCRRAAIAVSLRTMTFHSAREG